MYFLLEGFKEAALKFQQEAGLQEPALCSSLDERIMIREAVQTGRIPEAIAMVNALHPELLDNDRYLYFHLQVTYPLFYFIIQDSFVVKYWDWANVTIIF